MPKHALILGGGFAGLEAAIHLRKAGLQVTLVSDRKFLYLYPTSIWIPTGEMPFEKACVDLPSLAEKHGFEFVEGKVESIAGAKKSAVVAGKELSADYLLLAIGGGKLKPKGIEHTKTICAEPQGSLDLKAALDALLEKGQGRIAMGFGGNPKDGSAVRGGPAFELMFNVDTLLRRRGLREKFELTFFAPMAVPGQRMGEKAVAVVAKYFDQLGIKTRYGKKITEFVADGVVFEDGSKLDSDLVMFIAAGDGHPVIKASDLPKNDAGFVRIDEHCEVEGMPGVYAIGDSAALQGPEWRAKQGHIAEVMARTAAHNIAAQERGSAERESYAPHVNILCVMDTGNAAAWVYRDDQKQRVVMMPVFGHWMKKGWGTYFRWTKNGYMPRLPGM